MKLIAVLGATSVNVKHRYKYEDNCFEEYFAFLALSKALDIKDDDIVVIGTQKTKELLENSLYGISHTVLKNFVQISDERDIDSMYKTCLELITADTVLELTQGFRHMPMTLLLAGISSASMKNKNLKDIFYAIASKTDCNPAKEACEYEFISLQSYLDMANISTVIDSFCDSYFVPSINISYPKFVSLQVALMSISKHLLGNNFPQAIVEILALQQLLTSLSQTTFETLLQKLSEEIDFIATLSGRPDYIQLFYGSKKYLEKELLLHSVTTLFESVTAFIDAVSRLQNLEFISHDKRDKTVCKDLTDTYKRRNCLKKALEGFVSKNKNHKVFDQAFLSSLKKLDKLRNVSAHAHATEKSKDSYKQALSELLFYFGSKMVPKNG